MSKTILKRQAIPKELSKRHQWVLWKFDDERGKVPYQPDGSKANTADKKTWSTFVAVCKAYDNGGFDGIGYVFDAADPFTGIDLDGVIRTRRIRRWTEEQRANVPDGVPNPKEILVSVGSYAEVSPSGTGIKIICRAALPGSGRKIGDFEIYDRRRFFAITGRVLKSYSKVADANEFVSELYGGLPKRVSVSAADMNWTEEHPQQISDSKILRVMLREPVIQSLWSGDWNGYASGSEADLALINHIAYFAGPFPAIVDRIFRKSELCRDKWTDREDYRRNTLAQAITTKEQFHEWRKPIPALSTNASDESVPEELQCVPGFVDNVRNYTLQNARYAQPLLSLAGAMSLLATLLGNRVSCQQRCYTNLMFVMVAPTGSGKNFPREVNNSILANCDAIHLLSCENPASGPAILRVIEEHPVQLVQLDEFGRFLSTSRDSRSNAHGVVTELMKLATSWGQSVTRPYADKKKTFTIDNPLVVLFAGTTPDALFDAVTDTSLQDGFLPRLDLFVGIEYPEPKGFRPQNPIPSDIIETADAYLDLGPDQPGAGNGTPIRLIYTQKASQAFTEYQKFCTDRQRRNSRAGDVWTRSARKAASYAILHSLSRDPFTTSLDLEAMEWGAELQRRLTSYLCDYLAQWCAANPFDRKQKAMLRKVRKRGWISQSGLTRASQHLRSRERDELIDNLLDTGQMKETEARTKGRSVVIYFDPQRLNDEKAIRAYKVSRSRARST